MTSILVVDDEPLITSFVEKGLRGSGYRTVATHDGASALSMLDAMTFDLVILDIGLPDRTGLEVLAELRGRGDSTAVILLTARNEVESTVAGFEHGADDYMTKPFRFEELLARVRARLRATDPGVSSSTIERGGVVGRPAHPAGAHRRARDRPVARPSSGCSRRSCATPARC